MFLLYIYGLPSICTLLYYITTHKEYISWLTSFLLYSHIGNGNPLQYSCLENPMEGGAWWATVPWVAKSRTQLSDFTFTFI